ncbi:MAG: aminopeptidase P family protein [Candidatus Thorarchaeota archaeon]|nr:aminopeptidase P family protein [Candidatus Thorarchaeota archaeon]
MRRVEFEKSEQACDILRELDIDIWLVWVRETSQMADPVLPLVFGGDLVWHSALVYCADGTRTAIVGDFDAAAVEESGLFHKVVPYTKSIRDDLVSVLKDADPQKVAVNYSRNDVASDGLTVGMYETLREHLRDTPYVNRLVSAEGLITRLRGRKTNTEIERISRAVEITESILSEIAGRVGPGMTELQVYQTFHELMSRHGVSPAWSASHNPAVDAGPDKQFGHSGPTDRLLVPDNLVHFDFGVKWMGYCSDLQRMFFLGPPSRVPEEVRTAFDTVQEAIQRAAEFMRPGRLGHEVDSIARDFVRERGYEEYKHALGHQLGRAAHDGGTLLGPLWERYGDSPKGVVEVGNVFTLELYVTTREYGQVSLEEDILVTEDGCEFLSHPQRSLIHIER